MVNAHTVPGPGVIQGLKQVGRSYSLRISKLNSIKFILIEKTAMKETKF